MGLRPTFSFLDNHHIVAGFLWVSESQPRELLVCALDGQRLHDDHGPIDTVQTYLFRIPKILKRRDFWEIHTHRNAVPLHSDNPSTSTAAPPDPTNHHHYFDNDPADQLVVIEMASRRRSPHPADKPDPALSLCIPARAILRPIARAHRYALPPSPIAESSSAAHPPLVFSWEQWGEGRAHIAKRYDIDRRLPNLSRTCGLRHVTRKPVVPADGSPPVFHVMDFHPGRAARIARSGGSLSSSSSPSSLIHAVVEVPLPAEMQGVNPAFLSTAICQDALIVFEVCGKPLFLFFSLLALVLACRLPSLTYSPQRMELGIGGLRMLFICSF